MLEMYDLPISLMVTISQAVDGALFAQETEDCQRVSTSQSTVYTYP